VHRLLLALAVLRRLLLLLGTLGLEVAAGLHRLQEALQVLEIRLAGLLGRLALEQVQELRVDLKKIIFCSTSFRTKLKEVKIHVLIRGVQMLLCHLIN
jgi:hypothetical protein